MTQAKKEQAETMPKNEPEKVLTAEQLAEIAEQERIAAEAAFMADCEARAAELAKKYNVSKVYIYVGVSPNGEKIVGYIKEPSYIQKIVALDKIATVGMFMAADELRESLTLKDESDPRTYITSSDCDAYRLGMTGTCATMIEVVSNTFKKK